MARWFLPGLLTAGSLIAVAPAAKATSATVTSCGNIDVEANATCEVQTGVSCEANCSPIGCSAALYANCQTQCNAIPPSCDVSCIDTCQGNCSATASFNCSVRLQKYLRRNVRIELYNALPK